MTKCLEIVGNYKISIDELDPNVVKNKTDAVQKLPGP